MTRLSRKDPDELVDYIEDNCDCMTDEEKIHVLSLLKFKLGPRFDDLPYFTRMLGDAQRAVAKWREISRDEIRKTLDEKQNHN